MSLSDRIYDPFRRHDRYGTAGQTPQPLSEKLLLIALSILVVPLKIFGALTCLVSFYGFCRLSILIPASIRDTCVAAAGKIACRLCLFSLGFIRVRWERTAPKATREIRSEPCVIVSNHCSWVDILVHMSRFFPAFVARDSTKHLMLIGLISKKMGCLFVDRERRGGDTHNNHNHTGQGVGNVVKQRIQRAARGESGSARPMLLFPEGTTTNGRFLLPFKSGAFLAGCPVQPVILQYHQGRVSPTWESMQALQHVWLMLCIPFHSITAVELPIYVPSDEEVADPQLFAKNVRSYMLNCSGLKSSTSTLAEKREFHSLLRGDKPEILKKAS